MIKSTPISSLGTNYRLFIEKKKLMLLPTLHVSQISFPFYYSLVYMRLVFPDRCDVFSVCS